MKLKLAEYNKEEKFEGFFECGEGFLFGGDFIVLNRLAFDRKEFIYKKDEKDPLNRFNGFFNGRTYGNGCFILIEDDEDDVYDQKRYVMVNNIENNIAWVSHFTKKNLLRGYSVPDPELIGNLHQNPELYKKIIGGTEVPGI